MLNSHSIYLVEEEKVFGNTAMAIKYNGNSRQIGRTQNIPTTESAVALSRQDTGLFHGNLAIPALLTAFVTASIILC